MKEIVDPTISDFESNPTSVRHAFLACVATFHSLDYLTQPEKPANRRRFFRENSTEFAVVDRVAHAFKHVQTGHIDSPFAQPLKAGDIIKRPPAVWGEVVWDLSRWDDPVGGVTIRNDHEHDLLDIVKRAAAFVHSNIQT